MIQCSQKYSVSNWSVCIYCMLLDLYCHERPKGAQGQIFEMPMKKKCQKEWVICLKQTCRGITSRYDSQLYIWGQGHSEVKVMLLRIGIKVPSVPVNNMEEKLCRLTG